MGLALGAGVIIRPLIGRLLDRHGRKSWLLACGLLTSSACFLYIFVDQLDYLVMIIRILHGIGIGVLFAIYFTIAADSAPPGRDVEVISFFGISGLLPIALGPFLAEIILKMSSFTTLFIVAGCLSCCAFLITLSLPETRPSQGIRSLTERQTGSILVQLFPIMLGSFLFGAAINSVFNFLTLFINREGLGSINPFFTPYVMTSVLLRLAWSDVPDRYGHTRVYILCCLALALGLITVGFAHGTTMLILAGVLVGLGHAYIFPILIALSALRTSPLHRGRAVAWSTAVMDFGGMVSAPLLGYVGDLLGIRFLFFAAALLPMLALALFRSQPSKTSSDVSA